MSKWHRAAVAFLLGLHAACGLQTALVKSVTHDELWHLPVGVRNLRDGDFGADRLNPPLTRMWAAIPLVLGGVDVDRSTTGPLVGKKFTEDHPGSFQRWYCWGRVLNLAWSLATASIVYLWARDWFGPVPALLTLLLYTTCPNILAHASIVTPDAGLMCGFVATLYLLCRWCDRRTWGTALLFGLSLGLTQGLKFTGILLIPLVALMAAFRLWPRRTTASPRWSVVWGQFLAAMAVSLVTLDASYGFQGMFVPLGAYPFQSLELQTLQRVCSLGQGLPVPVPRDYLLGLDQQREIMHSAHPVFLDGRWSVTGFRRYYLMTLLYKLPHVFQVLLIVAVVAICSGGCGPPRWRDLLCLLLPIGLLLGVASLEGMQLGIRYVLPVLPLLMLIAGRAATVLAAIATPRKPALALIVASVCGLSLRHHPDHLAYFNELAGGPVGGRWHLLDSNLDWGQDLYLVKRYMSEHGLQQIGLAYFGTLAPQLLGIDFHVPPSWGPQPGVYAVSVNYVMGRPHILTTGEGTSRGTDFMEFGYFQGLEREATLGGSIDIYKITQEDVASWNETFKSLQQPQPRPSR